MRFLDSARTATSPGSSAGCSPSRAWRRISSNRAIRPIWTSPGYCHCNFTVLADFPEDQGQRWTNALFGMRYDNPRWRELMDLEGLKCWIPADPAILEGYRVLFEAVEHQGLARNWPF